MRSLPTAHRTARIALRTTSAQRRRCYGPLRSAGDVWAWVIDCNRQLREWHCPRVANFLALCRELTGTSFGELCRTCAEAVLKRYSIAFFEAAKRQKQGLRTGFPRRKRGLVPVRFRFGCFAVDGSRVRLGVARGAPELWVRLGREIPCPSESIRSLTLVAEAGRLYLDVTAEVPVQPGDLDQAAVAGIDLGIIHPYAVMAGDEGLLVSGRAIRAEERLHLEGHQATVPEDGRKGSHQGPEGEPPLAAPPFLPAESRGSSPPKGAPGAARGGQGCGGMAGGAHSGHGGRRRSQGHHHQGLRAAPEPAASQLPSHASYGMPFRQGRAGGDQGRARERAWDVVHLPGVPQGRPQAEGTLVLLPALRAHGPPRSRRSPKHRRPGRRIHACTRTPHAPSGWETPSTA